MAKLISFQNRVISIAEGQTCIIGRASFKSGQIAASDNLYFDNPVLSRIHATMSSKNGNIYIEDSKSTHGTKLSESGALISVSPGNRMMLRDESVLVLGTDVFRDQEVFKCIIGVIRIREAPAIPPHKPTATIPIVHCLSSYVSNESEPELTQGPLNTWSKSHWSTSAKKEALRDDMHVHGETLRPIPSSRESPIVIEDGTANEPLSLSPCIVKLKLSRQSSLPELLANPEVAETAMSYDLTNISDAGIADKITTCDEACITSEGVVAEGSPTLSESYDDDEDCASSDASSEDGIDDLELTLREGNPWSDSDSGESEPSEYRSYNPETLSHSGAEPEYECDHAENNYNVLADLDAKFCQEVSSAGSDSAYAPSERSPASLLDEEDMDQIEQGVLPDAEGREVGASKDSDETSSLHPRSEEAQSESGELRSSAAVVQNLLPSATTSLCAEQEILQSASAADQSLSDLLKASEHLLQPAVLEEIQEKSRGILRGLHSMDQRADKIFSRISTGRDGQTSFKGCSEVYSDATSKGDDKKDQEPDFRAQELNLQSQEPNLHAIMTILKQIQEMTSQEFTEYHKAWIAGDAWFEGNRLKLFATCERLQAIVRQIGVIDKVKDFTLYFEEELTGIKEDNAKISEAISDLAEAVQDVRDENLDTLQIVHEQLHKEETFRPDSMQDDIDCCEEGLTECGLEDACSCASANEDVADCDSEDACSCASANDDVAVCDLDESSASASVKETLAECKLDEHSPSTRIKRDLEECGPEEPIASSKRLKTEARSGTASVSWSNTMRSTAFGFVLGMGMTFGGLVVLGDSAI